MGGRPVIELRVYGFPIAQGRPRAFKTPSGHVRVFDPSNSRDWKRTVQGQLLTVKPPTLLLGPLRVSLVFSLPRPTSLPKRVIFCVKRPDIENLAKAILDAMTAVIYRDDAQIVELHVRKEYSAEPGVLIRVEEL